MTESSESARRGGSFPQAARVLNDSGTGRREAELARLSEGKRVEERSRSSESVSFSEETTLTSKAAAEKAGCWSDSDGRDMGLLLSLFEKVSRRFCTEVPESSCASLVPGAAAAASTFSSIEASGLDLVASHDRFSCE